MSDPKNAVVPCKDFFLLVTEAHICAAAMKVIHYPIHECDSIIMYLLIAYCHITLHALSPVPVGAWYEVTR